MSNAGQKIAAVVLAAGKGTRMKSGKAKVLHEVNGRPIGFYPIRAALALDASPVVVVVGHQAQSVEVVFFVAPIGAAAPRSGLEQAALLVVANGALGQPRRVGDVSDAQHRPALWTFLTCTGETIWGVS